MRHLKTYEDNKYDNIINKYVVYFYGDSKKINLTHIKDISVTSVSGLDYVMRLGKWTNYKLLTRDVRFMNILGIFDTLKEATDFYDMAEETNKYNL